MVAHVLPVERQPVDSRSWIDVVQIALFHPEPERLRELDGYVDERLRGRRS